jgi:hypothetical protein
MGSLEANCQSRIDDGLFSGGAFVRGRAGVPACLASRVHVLPPAFTSQKPVRY